MTRDRLRPATLARRVLLPPLLAGAAVVCLLVALATAGGPRAKADNPLGGVHANAIVTQIAVDLEGTPTRADIRRAKRPLSERRRLLAAHPYYPLYKAAGERLRVSWYLVASVHYQETGFGEAPARLAQATSWGRHRYASSGGPRPARYPHRSDRHPSIRDDFDVVMAIADELRDGGATGLGPAAERAVAARYGSGAGGRLSTAMIIERARAWRLLGTLPQPGRGELATPIHPTPVVGGCGYFGCPRPGHLHNGVDYLAPTGTPIHAAESGRVVVLESVSQSGGYGNFVCLQHRPHLATCYAHLSAFAANVAPGASLRRGQVLGLVGSTGSSSAPHLHFEVRRGHATCSTCAVDPLPLLSGEVPETAVPEMVGLPAATTPAAADPAPPPAVQATAPPPAATAPAPAAEEPVAEPDAAQPPSEPRRPRNPVPSAPATGGAALNQPAPAPPRQAPKPPPPAPATPPPAGNATGGAVPDTAPAATAPTPPPPVAPPALTDPATPAGTAAPGPPLR